ncbi:hypothetical protein CRYUN_Cryun22dG0013200 [Craigia yunnanensis]
MANGRGSTLLFFNLILISFILFQTELTFPLIKKETQQLKEASTFNLEEEDDEQQDEGYLKSDDGFVGTDKEAAKGEEETEDADDDKDDGFVDENSVPNSKKKKKKEKLLKEATEADNRGVCYLSRIPPRIMSSYASCFLSMGKYIGFVLLLLVSHPPQVKGKHPRPSKVQEQEFSEGWVEFARKGIAKGVVNMLNGEQIAYKSAIREQKLALEISAAKRERDFNLSKVDQSRALSSIEKRMKKFWLSYIYMLLHSFSRTYHTIACSTLRSKRCNRSRTNSELPVSQKKVIRQFPQKKPVAIDTSQSKPRLSKDILAEC